MKKHLTIIAFCISIFVLISVFWGNSFFALTENENITEGDCGANLTWNFDEESGTLTISGTGEMYDYSSNSYGRPPWHGMRISKVLVLDGVTSIGVFSFSECGSVEEIVIPGSVTEIGAFAFEDCISLKKVLIEDGVERIAEWAFMGCSDLASITIPNSVTEIGAYAFEDCNNIKTAGPIGSGCNYEFGWLREIPANAFSVLKSLQEVNLPNSIETIGNGSFSGCIGLTNISIPSGVSSIGNWAFSNCSELTYVSIPNSIISIGEYAFFECSNLKSITLPNGLKSIKRDAFQSTGLKDITIPDSVERIDEVAFSYNTVLFYSGNATGSNWGAQAVYSYYDGDLAFTSYEKKEIAYCKKSATNIIIPNSVTTIGARAFCDCENLTTIAILGSISNIGEDAFYNSAYYNNPLNWENDVFLYIDGCFIRSKETATKCDVKEGTTVIADCAFSDCNRLDTITLPSSLIGIGEKAFSGCSALTNIVIPEGVERIKNSTFSNCTNLSTVFLPNGIKAIDDYAFYFCQNLYTLNLPDSIEIIGKYAFAGGKKGFTTIYGARFLNLTIPKQCNIIGENAFYYCRNMQTVSFPECDFSIGKGAFDYCTSLSTVTIPDNCQYIDGTPFSNCSSLKSIMVDAGNSQFSSDVEGVLYSKDKKILLKYPEGKQNAIYAILDGTEEVDVSAFVPNNKIKTITFPSSVKTVKDGAFSDNKNLATVYYPGTQAEWYEIIIGGNNEYLLNATKYFEHTHLGEITTELRNVREATCTENGYSGDLCCSVCGAIVESGSVQPAKGHRAEEWTVTRPASCSEFGEKVKICDTCGDIIAEEQISKLPHTYDEYFIPATCTEEGQEICLCSECGYGYAKPTPKLNHSFTNYIYNNDATTEKDGTETAKCDRCDATDTRTKPGTKLSGGSDAPEDPAAPGSSEAPEDPTVPGGSEAPAEPVAPDKPDVSKVKISAPTGIKKINWRCKAHLTATAANLPESCHIEWYENGKSVCDKADFVTASLTEAHTYTAKIIDEKGNAVSTPAQEKTVTIEVKDDFFTKIISFFSRLFGSDVVKV